MQLCIYLVMMSRMREMSLHQGRPINFPGGQNFFRLWQQQATMILEDKKRQNMFQLPLILNQIKQPIFLPFIVSF